MAGDGSSSSRGCWLVALDLRVVNFDTNIWKTVVCGVIAYLFLPSSIATASFMKPEERAFAISRLSGHMHIGGTEGERFK